MKHEIYPMRASEDGELLPPVVVEVPDVLYLQVVDTDDCEDWPAPSEPSERTFTTERLNASDVAYVPLARAERAEGECEALRAERDAAVREVEGIFDSAAETELRLNATIDALRAELDAAREAARVPDDWPHGLPSWIAQRLYAAYIGAAFAPDVMEQIAAGRLTFPEAPIYAEAAALRAELDAARGVETAEQPPEVGQRVQIIITADFVHGGFEPVADNRLFLPRHMAPFWRPLWAGTERGYEIHTITGSTSAGRRRARRGEGVAP